MRVFIIEITVDNDYASKGDILVALSSSDKMMYILPNAFYISHGRYDIIEEITKSDFDYEDWVIRGLYEL